MAGRPIIKRTCAEMGEKMGVNKEKIQAVVKKLELVSIGTINGASVYSGAQFQKIKIALKKEAKSN